MTEHEEVRRLEAELFEATEAMADRDAEISRLCELLASERLTMAEQQRCDRERHAAELAELREQAVRDRDSFEQAMRRVAANYRAEFRNRLDRIRVEINAATDAVREK